MKKIFKLMLVLTMVVTVVGCGEKKESSKDTFIMAIDADPSNIINVVTTSDRNGLMTVNAVFSQLYVYKAGEDLEYKLAESIETKDDMLYTVKLKKDVLWHDGEKFNADDVVFTFQTLLDNEQSEQSGPLQFGGDKVEISKVDDYTVEFKLKSPKPNAIEVFGAAFIMPEHIYKDVTDYASSTIVPVGTGPYKYVEYNEGESTVFEANDDYFDGKPEIKNLIFKVISEADSATLAMQNNEVNGLSVLPEDVDKFGDSVSVNAYSEGRIGYMSFNFKPESANYNLVSDANFRKGVLYAINKEDVIKASYVSDEYSLNPASFLPSTALYTSDDVEKYDDAKKAKEYLAKANVTSANLTLAYPNNPASANTAAVIQDNLKDVGITLETTPMDPPAFYKTLNEGSGNFDLFLSGYIMTIDPDGYAPLFKSDSEMNFSKFSSPKIDELFAAGISETEDSARKEIYGELQTVFMDEAFFLPLTENKRVVVVSADVNIKDAEFAPIYTFADWSKLSYK